MGEKITLVVLVATTKEETEKDHSPQEGDALLKEPTLVVEMMARNFGVETVATTVTC